MTMKWLLIIVIIVLLSGGIWFWTQNNKIGNSSSAIYKTLPMVEQIKFTTRDGFIIAGDYYAASSTRGVVLLHMMPATKESWVTFAEKLQKAGFNVLAIDLHGHGVSDEGPGGYKSFSDTQHQSSINDVGGAVEFLKGKGMTDIHLGGASIGANLALWYLADHPEIKSAILLSAGLDYRGVKTEVYAKNVKPDQSIYFVADKDDERSFGGSAVTMAQQLYDVTPAKKEIKIFKGAGHGTDMFDAHPELMDQLVEWIKNL